jgi:DNA-binding NtrC family response regulator
MFTILAVEDAPNWQVWLRQFFATRLPGYRLRSAETADQALEQLQAEEVTLVLLDLMVPKSVLVGEGGEALLENGIQVGNFVCSAFPHARLMLLTQVAEATTATDLIRRWGGFGQVEYVCKDAEDFEDRFLLTMERLIGCVACRSPAMQRLTGQMSALAQEPLLVLQGEDGSGRRYLAHLCHRRVRPGSPFTEVSLPRLASLDLAQMLDQAAPQGSTLFLTHFEYVRRVPEPQQAHLTALLQTLGEERQTRVVLSTSEPLDQLCREGCLSPARAARLRSAPTLDVPPLRARTDDLPLLLDLFRVQHGWDHQLRVRSASPGVTEVLRYYGEQTGWPGSVAELDRLIARSVQKCAGEVLRPDHLDVALPEEYRAVYNYGEGIQRSRLSYRVARCPGGHTSRFFLTQRGEKCAFNTTSRFALIEKELSAAGSA